MLIFPMPAPRAAWDRRPSRSSHDRLDSAPLRNSQPPPRLKARVTVQGPRSFFFCLMLAAAWTGFASAQSMDLPTPVGMDGDPAALMVTHGNAAFLHGDLRGAATFYRQALQRKSDFAIATFNLGLVEMHTGDRTRGVADMNRGIALATRHGMSDSDVARLRELRSAFTTQAKPT